MDEFDFIRTILAPLAGEGAFGLADDAALLHAGAGGLVVTADMMVEGRHFRPDCPPETVAQKALRANLSDLAAKGARPLSYLLSIAWPQSRDQDFRAAFVSGLAADQARYGVSLLGGDTTVTDGPFTIAITAFGAPLAPERRPGMVPRAGACLGDAVFVTGTVGAAGLGLAVLEGASMPPGADGDALVAAYRLPEPPVDFAPAVAEHASASIDVSDGVLADAAHIARASAMVLEIALESLPLSPAASAWLAAQPDRDAALARLAAHGDDYQILFCAPPEAEPALAEAADRAGIALGRIGRVLPSMAGGTGLRVLGAAGEVEPERLGFTHF